MVKSVDIGPLVGAGKFFKAVSSRMAYALPIGHEMGLRSDSHSASSRAGSFNVFFAEWLAAERAKGFLGYDPDVDNKVVIGAGERVLLGVLPMCSVIFGGEVYRSDGTETAFYKDATTGEDAEFTSYKAMLEMARALGNEAYMKLIPKPADDVLNPAQKLPINACVGGSGYEAFPAFDLFASRIGVGRVTDAPHSWPTIKLAGADEMPASAMHMVGLDGFMLPEVGGCQDWLVWMVPSDPIPENAFMRLKWDVLTAGK